MTVYKLAAFALLAVVSLTSCAASEPVVLHATSDDCVVWMVEALESRGTDTAPLIESGELFDHCDAKLVELGQEEFDKVFLSDPTP